MSTIFSYQWPSADCIFIKSSYICAKKHSALSLRHRSLEHRNINQCSNFNTMQRKMVGCLLLFTSSDIIRETEGDYYNISCWIRFPFAFTLNEKRSCLWQVSFSSSKLQEVSSVIKDLPESANSQVLHPYNSIDELLQSEERSSLFGIRITSVTQVLPACSTTPVSWASGIASTRNLRLYSPDIIRAIVGAMLSAAKNSKPIYGNGAFTSETLQTSLIAATACTGSSPSQIQSLLVVGESGTGCTSLLRSISSQLHNVHLVAVSPSMLFGLNGDGGTHAALEGFNRIVLQALTLATASSNKRQALANKNEVAPSVVLLIEDLHVLTPKCEQRTNGDAAATSITEAVCDLLRRLDAWRTVAATATATGSNSTNAKHHTPAAAGIDYTFHQQALPSIFVCGCAYSTASISPEVRNCFQEVLHVPVPGLREKRAILSVACEDIIIQQLINKKQPNPKEDEQEERALFRSVKAEILSYSEAVMDNGGGPVAVPTLTYLHWAKRIIAQKILEIIQQHQYPEQHTMKVPSKLTTISPNSAKQVTDNNNTALFSQVAGLRHVKRVLEETILWPRHFSHLYHAFLPSSSSSSIVSSCAGLLLFGPPGTGKTLLPRSIAQELGCQLVNMGLCDIVRGEIGTGERRIAQLFHEAKRSAPCILFIDEFQALFAARDGGGSTSTSTSSLSAALAVGFDDLNAWNQHAGGGGGGGGGDAVSRMQQQVTVIASTNEPWAIDRSFLRPGRFEKILFVGPLDVEGRCVMLLKAFETLCFEQSEVEYIKDIAESEQFLDLIQRTDGFTGSDLKLLISRAVQSTIRTNEESQVSAESDPRATIESAASNIASFVTILQQLLNALNTTEASVTQSELDDYTYWGAEFSHLQ